MTSNTLDIEVGGRYVVRLTASRGMSPTYVTVRVDGAGEAEWYCTVLDGVHTGKQVGFFRRNFVRVAE